MNLYTKYTPPIPMMANDWDPYQVVYPVIIQRKFNGVRGLISPDGKVYYGRGGGEIPTLKGQFGAYGCWLDGEIYLEGKSLNDIAGRLRLAEPSDRTKELEFILFDVVAYDSQYERIDHIAEILRDDITNVKFASIALVDDPTAANDVYLHLPAHYEGIIYRDPHAIYTHGKTNFLLKRKKLKTAEYKCVGVQEGVGKFYGTLGAFICELPDTIKFNVSAAELTNTERDAMWKSPPIGEMLTVRYPELSQYNIPQQAQFVCVRKAGE